MLLSVFSEVSEVSVRTEFNEHDVFSDERLLSFALTWREQDNPSGKSLKPTLDLVQVAGLFLWQQVGVGIFPGVDFVHEQGTEPASVSAAALRKPPTPERRWKKVWQKAQSDGENREVVDY